MACEALTFLFALLEPLESCPILGFDAGGVFLLAWEHARRCLSNSLCLFRLNFILGTIYVLSIGTLGLLRFFFSATYTKNPILKLSVMAEARSGL